MEIEVPLNNRQKKLKSEREKQRNTKINILK